MPFLKPSGPAVGDFVYVRDPEETNVQYRAKVLAVEKGLMSVGLFPDPEVEPLWGSLDGIYIIPLDLPVTECSKIIYPGAELRGYQTTLLKAGQPAPGWKAADGRMFDDTGKVVGSVAPAAASAPPQPLGMTADLAALNKSTPAAAPGTAPSTAGEALAQQQARVQADLAAAATLPPVTLDMGKVAVGAAVQVKVQEHTFWGPLAGKQGVIKSISPGEPQWVLDVDIEGIEYQNVAVGRFEHVSGASLPVTPATQPAAPAKESAYPTDLIGQLVSLKVDWTESVFNGILEACGPEGVVMMNGQVTAPWDRVVKLEKLNYHNIPGAPPPKAPRAPKGSAAPAVAQASPSGSAAVPAPSPEPERPTSIVQSATGAQTVAEAVGRVIAAVETILGGKKVSRSMVEGLRPLLAEAEALAKGAPPANPPPANPPTDAQMHLNQAIEGGQLDAFRARAKALHNEVGEALSQALDALGSFKTDVGA